MRHIYASKIGHHWNKLCLLPVWHNAMELTSGWLFLIRALRTNFSEMAIKILIQCNWFENVCKKAAILFVSASLCEIGISSSTNIIIVLGAVNEYQWISVRKTIQCVLALTNRQNGPFNFIDIWEPAQTKSFYETYIEFSITLPWSGSYHLKRLMCIVNFNKGTLHKLWTNNFWCHMLSSIELRRVLHSYSTSGNGSVSVLVRYIWVNCNHTAKWSSKYGDTCGLFYGVRLIIDMMFESYMVTL